MPTVSLADVINFNEIQNLISSCFNRFADFHIPIEKQR